MVRLLVLHLSDDLHVLLRIVESVTLNLLNIIIGGLESSLRFLELIQLGVDVLAKSVPLKVGGFVLLLEGL